MTKLTIFGERPGPNTDPFRPLFPHTTTGAAARLIDLMGWSQEKYLQETDRYNVCLFVHDRPSDEKTRERVAAIMSDERAIDPNAKFLFVGKATIQAAPERYRKMAFGQTKDNVMLIPHTSGRNRFYNDPGAVKEIRELLALFLEP